MICSYLLHDCNVIRILRLRVEERGVNRALLCSLKMTMIYNLCNKYEQTTLSYILRIQGVPKTVLRLINNGTKDLCSIFLFKIGVT